MKKKYRIMLDVFIIIVSLGFIAGIIDYNRVKENKSPIFCIKLKDGSTGKVTYIGLGYKVIRYTGVSINEPFRNNIGVKFGSLFMSFKLEDVENKNIDNIDNIDSFYNHATTKGYVDIRKLDSNYTIDKAIKDNCFVISNAKVYNDNLYDTFMGHYQKKEDTFIRVVQLTVEGDLVILDLMYDSENDEIILVTDSTRDEFAGKEDKTIQLSKYEKTTEYEYEDHLYWVLYNGDIGDLAFHSDDVYLIVSIS